MCKNMLRCFFAFVFFFCRYAEGSNKFSADEKSQIPIEVNINSNWKININSALAGLQAVDGRTRTLCRIDFLQL